MKFKEVFLLILIIAIGVFFYHAQTGKLHIDFDWGEGIFFSYDEFTYEESKEIPPPYPQEIQVINSHGDVEIIGTDEEKITVYFEEKIRRKNQEDADEVADKLKMMVSTEFDRLTIRTSRDDFRRKHFDTDFRIYLPAGMDITIKNSYGLVSASNVGNADINNRHGEIIASNINGEIIIKSTYEDVEVKNVRSDCQIDSRNSDLTVTAVSGDVRIYHRYGKVYLEDIVQNVTVEGTHNEVFGRRIAGAVNVENSYERITLFDVGPTTLRGKQSPIEVNGVEGDLEIYDRYSKVKLNDIQGNLLIEGKDLSVYGREIVGEKISVSSSYKAIELHDFSGKTTVSLSNGDLTLSPYPLTHPIEVIGEYTDILFYWPGEGKYPLEARNKGGDVKWALPVELSYQEENSLTIIKAFTEEQLNPSIFLSTTYGTIRIEE